MGVRLSSSCKSYKSATISEFSDLYIKISNRSSFIANAHPARHHHRSSALNRYVHTNSLRNARTYRKIIWARECNRYVNVRYLNYSNHICDREQKTHMPAWPVARPIAELMRIRYAELFWSLYARPKKSYGCMSVCMTNLVLTIVSSHLSFLARDRGSKNSLRSFDYQMVI
jgi:hypothetical protein